MTLRTSLKKGEDPNVVRKKIIRGFFSKKITNKNHKKILPFHCFIKANKLNYLRMINGILPDEIRLLSIKPVDSSFNARFDCTRRTYKYFFF